MQDDNHDENGAARLRINFLINPKENQLYAKSDSTRSCPIILFHTRDENNVSTQGNVTPKVHNKITGPIYSADESQSLPTTDEGCSLKVKLQPCESIRPRRLDPIIFANHYPITFATFILIRKLVKQGTLKKENVVEILNSCSKCLLDSFNHRPSIRSNGSDSVSSAIDAAVSIGITFPPGNSTLCGGVAARLAALRDRIRASGSVVLPPSRAVMGPPFVPALEFLRGLVLDASISCVSRADVPDERLQRARSSYACREDSDEPPAQIW